MRLVLIRHAEAGDRDPGRYPDDGLRPILPSGRSEHELVAAALPRVEPEVYGVLSSPLLRARETAEITCRALGIAPDKIQLTDSLGDRPSVSGLLAELHRMPEDAVVVAVGHEPHLSELAARFLRRGGEIAIDFKKSGMLCLDFSGQAAEGKGELKFYLVPKLLPPPVS